ncbi:hypothetical protein BHE74_00021683 [Ensete ventricosum]|nr:hypothetical protein GW17_00004784 [Ensete ventricosum]RWW70618.1 hypothetical protein BHE74_00021683 [Ensete ventricosum]RZS23469.1 hypothetical protein BHM03_00056414 [Ensete ventricosum]
MEQDLTKSRSSLRCHLLLWVSEISMMRLLMFHWRRQTIPERRHKNFQHGKQN